MKRFFTCLSLLVGLQLSATNYYVNPVSGKSGNNGTSMQTPFKLLSQLDGIAFQPGDSILLSTVGVHRGGVLLNEIAGTAAAPIVITAYDRCPGERKLARINAAGKVAGVLLDNCSHIHLSRLEITADGGKIDKKTEAAHMRCGVLVRGTEAGIFEDFWLEQLHVSDIFYYNKNFKRDESEVKTANGRQPYGYGIRFVSKHDEAVLKDIHIQQCTVRNTGHTGIKFTGSNQSIADFHIGHNLITQTGGPGMQGSRVRRGHVFHNHVSYSGSNDDTRKWGRGSGLWTWGADSVLIERNHFLYANGPADSAGAHIDFNCSNVILQYNFSAYNAGGFCEILGNNFNCAYRYNVSVNDGYRTKGVNGAFQEGKTLWTSGFIGKAQERFGPMSCYIYNNTIYVDREHTAKIAFENTTKGLLVTNNIFYLEGDCKKVMGDQYNPETVDGRVAENIWIDNNLFLSTTAWNKEILHPNKNASIGNPDFVHGGGLAIEDYQPRHAALVKDKGKDVRPLAGAPMGLMGGMQLAVDILGNPIQGLPDMGAIEME